MSIALPAWIPSGGEDWLVRMRESNSVCEERDDGRQEKWDSETIASDYMNPSEGQSAQQSDYVRPDGGSEDNVSCGSSKQIAKVIDGDDSGIEVDRKTSLVNHFPYKGSRRSGEEGSVSNIDATRTDRNQSSDTSNSGKKAGNSTRQAKVNDDGGTTAPNENGRERAGGVIIGFGDEDLRELVELQVSKGVRRNRTHDPKHTATARKIQRKIRSRQEKTMVTSRVIHEHNCATKIQAVARGWRLRLGSHTLGGFEAKTLKNSENANKDVLATPLSRDHRYSVHVNSSHSFTRDILDEHAAAKRIQTQARRRFAMKHRGTGPSGQAEVPEHDVVGCGKMFLTEDDTEKGIHEQVVLGNQVTNRPNIKHVEIFRRFQVPLDEVEAARRIQRQKKSKIAGVGKCREVRGGIPGVWSKKLSLKDFDGGAGMSRATDRDGREGVVVPRDIGQNFEFNVSSEAKRETLPQLPSPQQEKRSGLNRPSKEAAVAVVEKRIEEVAVVGVRAVEESTDAGSFVRAEAAERPSPEQSTLRVTTGGTVSTRSGDSRSPNESTPPHSRGSRINGGSSKGIEEVARGRRAEHDFKGDACDEEMLKKARKQTQRHTRDRKARALAREEKSKRELRVVQAELKTAEDLRAKQAMAERSALEAKRSRVLEDMKRRQRRLQRLQEQAQRCSSIASSAGAEVEAKGEAEGHHKSPRTQDGSDSGRVSSEKAAFLPPLRPLTGDLEEPPRRKHGKYVSKFREHILEERRVWMEDRDLKWKLREQKVRRQADYASKIRNHAKRALVAEQRRLQARQRSPRAGQFVDRTPVLIKKPRHGGGSGIFSYAPSRPDLGAKERGEEEIPDQHPTSGYRTLGRGQKRLVTSKMAERIRQETTKAAEASRARAKAVAPSRGYSNSRYARLSTGQRTWREGVEGDAPETESGGHGNSCSHRLAPLQMACIRGGSTSGRLGLLSGGVDLNCDNRKVGEALLRKPANADKRPIACEDICAMYEERLASLERRVAMGGKYCRRIGHEGPSRNAS